MKKIFIGIFIFLIFTGVSVAATTALYRTSSNEVYMIDTGGGLFPNHTNSYLSIKENATFVDGTNCRDANGDLGVLGISKIIDGDNVRNATQEEIDTFFPATVSDYHQIEADKAVEYLKKHPQFRRIMTAFASILVDEFNILRSEHGLANRTLLQLKTAIENRINKDD